MSSEVKSVQSALSDLLTTSAMHGTFSCPSTNRGLILTNSSEKRFDERAQCLANQYSQYSLYGKKCKCLSFFTEIMTYVESVPNGPSCLMFFVSTTEVVQASRKASD